MCIVHTASAQDSNTICNAQTTCANCIQASPLCSWCTAQVKIIHYKLYSISYNLGF